VLRFHAVYWPAILLSAGEPLPTEIVVHDYLTAGGRKISKSSGADLADPVAVAGEYGTDAVRWWLLREVPRVGDADFTTERLVNRANQDLANGLGNLVNRVTTLAHAAGQPAPPAAQDAQSCDGPAAVAGAAAALEEAVAAAPGLVAAALDDADFRAAIGAVWRIVDAANRYAEEAEPWRLAKAARAGDREAAGPLAEVLGRLLRACRALAAELTPFTPGLAARVDAAIGARPGEPVPAPAGPLFPRLARPASDGDEPAAADSARAVSTAR
jgi:methionyl-tRNA synthetase